MLSLAILLVLSLVFALLRGGSLESLAETRFRAPWLLFLGLGVQLAVDFSAPSWLEGNGGLAVILATNAAVATFLFLNRSYAGTGLAALGLLLNVLVISVNGAMPVNPSAVRDAGIETSLENVGLKHEVMDDDTVLPWLGDTIGLPKLRELLSVGDVVLALGIAWLVHAAHDGREVRGKTQHPRRVTSGACG